MVALKKKVRRSEGRKVGRVAQAQHEVRGDQPRRFGRGNPLVVALYSHIIDALEYMICILI